MLGQELSNEQLLIFWGLVVFMLVISAVAVHYLTSAFNKPYTKNEEKCDVQPTCECDPKDILCHCRA